MYKKRHSDYICVADGVILDIANRNSDYLNVVNGGLFAICDSSYVPLYLKWLYGNHISNIVEVKFLKILYDSLNIE